MRAQVEIEIREQPQALARTVEGVRSAAAALAQDVRRRKIEWVMIAARGTSDHAAVYATYLLAAYNGLPVSLATPSLYTWYHRPPRLASALVLGISQSGMSEDVVEVLTEAKRQGAVTAAVTNEPDSPLAGTVDHVLALAVGPERAVAATKTYTATLAVLALLSAELEQDERPPRMARAAARHRLRHPGAQRRTGRRGAQVATPAWTGAWSSAAATTTPPRSRSP